MYFSAYFNAYLMNAALEDLNFSGLDPKVSKWKEIKQ